MEGLIAKYAVDANLFRLDPQSKSMRGAAPAPVGGYRGAKPLVQKKNSKFSKKNAKKKFSFNFFFGLKSSGTCAEKIIPNGFFEGRGGLQIIL